MPAVYAVDANVLVRFAIGDVPALAAKAKAVMKAVEAGEVTLECDPVTLAEAVWVMTSFYGISPQDIADELVPLIQLSSFRLSDKARYVGALEAFGAGELSFGDACACATAEMEAEGRLISFDRALSKVVGIKRTEAVRGA